MGRVFLARGISQGQKWWQTLLGREISCSQWEVLSMDSRCLAFCPFKFCGVVVGAKDFFSFFLGFQCLQAYVLIRCCKSTQFHEMVPSFTHFNYTHKSCTTKHEFSHKHALGCVEISLNLTINKSTATSNWPPHTRVTSKVPKIYWAWVLPKLETKSKLRMKTEQRKNNRGPNWSSHLNWSSQEFHP